MSQLFTPFKVKGLDLKNRIVMSPMCQYSVSARDGKPNDWHFVHYTSRAIGGTALVLTEMTDVEPDGRITDFDLGFWSDDHVPAFARLAESIHQHGAKFGIQLAHAGRKAQDAKVPVAPSAIAFNGPGYKVPHALSADEIKRLVNKFAAAAKRAVLAGADTVELHAAHGYLIHQFQSPLTNKRTDAYGEDKALFGTQVAEAVKAVLPSSMPLFMRVSAVEYMDGGYDIPYIIEICRKYHRAGVDVFHISSGGEGPAGTLRKPGNFPGFHVPFARAVKNALNVPVAVVGKLEYPALAESVISNGDADLVAIGRGILRDPYWAIHAAQALGVEPVVPNQYKRAY